MIVNVARSPGSARTWCHPPRMARRNGSTAAAPTSGEREAHARRRRPITARKLTVLMASAHVMPPTPMATAAATGRGCDPRFHWAEDSPMAAGRSSARDEVTERRLVGRGSRWRPRSR